MMLKRLFIGIVFLLLTSCGMPSQSTPAPTLEAINIVYPPSLQPWADKLSNCAADFPELALYFFPQIGPYSTNNSNEIDLFMGQPTGGSSGRKAYQVGWEKVVVVVNKNNSLEELSDDPLKQIFSGKTENWENDSGQPIQVWSLLENDPSRQIFEQAVVVNGQLANETKLAPDPQGMVEEIAKDENAIGYLPASYLDNENLPDVKLIQLEPSMEQALRQPVVAITQGEPTGLMRSLLICLQNLDQ